MTGSAQLRIDTADEDNRDATESCDQHGEGALFVIAPFLGYGGYDGLSLLNRSLRYRRPFHLIPQISGILRIDVSIL